MATVPATPIIAAYEKENMETLALTAWGYFAKGACYRKFDSCHAVQFAACSLVVKHSHVPHATYRPTFPSSKTLAEAL